MLQNWFTNPFRRTETYSSDPDVMRTLRSISRSAVSTVEVTEDTALNLIACYAAIRVLSEDIGSLPLPLYQRLSAGGRQSDRSHPLWYLLNVSPDNEITGMQYREHMMKCLLSNGNSYSEIERRRSGELLAIHKLDPKNVTPERNKTGKIVYKVEGSKVAIPFRRMLHVSGLGDGLVGLSPIALAKQSISAGMMMDQFGAAWFANGSKGGMTITHPGQLSPTAQENLRNTLDEIHGGPANFGKNMILEEGMKAEPSSIPPEDAQFLATRTFNIQEICRLFRIPCTLLQENSRSTFSNSEQEALNYEKFGIRPWLERIEAQINFKLLTRKEQESFFVEHMIDSLLRADIKTRYDVYSIARNNGLMNADEIRAKENMNPLPDGQGQLYLLPMNNMEDAAKVAEESPAIESDPKPVEDELSEEIETNSQHKNCIADESKICIVPRATPDIAIFASRAALIDSFDRMYRREHQAIERASKNPRQFLDSVDEFYSKHREIMSRAIQPNLDAYMALLNRSHDAQSLSDTICNQNKKTLLELSGAVTMSQLAPAVAVTLANWQFQPTEIVAQLAT